MGENGRQADSYSPFDAKLDWHEKVAYLFGDFGANMDKNMVGTFCFFFWTEFLGLAPGVCSLIILLSRVADAFSDVGMGMIMENTKSRFGKARSWLLRVSVPYGLAPVLLFSIPGFGPLGRIVWAIIAYNLVMTVFATMYNMPYGTLGSLITQNYDERSLLNILRMIGGISASIIVAFFTLPMVDVFGGGSRGWQLTSLCVGIIATICILIVFFNTRERVVSVEKKKVRFVSTIKTLMKNKYWVMAIFMNVMTQFMIGFIGINIYYSKYVLNNVYLISIFSLFYFLPNFAGFAIMPLFIKRYGKRNTVLAGFLGFLLFSLCLHAFAGTNLVLILTFVSLRGVALAPLIGSVYAFVYDTIE
ncbi:MAG: MFS transporter, partial [Treponema sp.]|nr:MFS transporter [Treponema sp.]